MATEFGPAASPGVHPYTAGGGGTTLEHRYGAVLAASVLTGDPVTELGDSVTPGTVFFQASAFSPVDDLVISGEAPDGSTHRVSIGVRRDPKVIPSSDETVRLIGTFLRVVVDHWPSVRDRLAPHSCRGAHERSRRSG